MTTTAPSPRLADPSRDTVRDPDWILARLQHIRADATEYADERDPAGYHENKQAYLAIGLKRFETELRMWGTAADAVMDILDSIPQPPLHWSRDCQRDGTLRGLAGCDYPEADKLRVVQQWAHTLGFAESNTVMSGIREWAGEIDGFAVAVWCITNRDAFDGRHKTPAPITDNPVPF